MTSYSSLRARLVGTVLVAITPAWILMYYTDLHWSGFLVGLFALGAAWVGGERFVNRQVRLLLSATQRLTEGDLSSRTGLAHERGELGDLARQFDQLAERLERRAQQGDLAEKNLLNRSLQQTVVSALGQFALVTPDFKALLDQVVLLVSQTLEVEHCQILEALPNEDRLVLAAGVGWKNGLVARMEVDADPETHAGFSLRAGEPVVIKDLKTESRFKPAPFLLEHDVHSSVTVTIGGSGGKPFGILGAHTSRSREFSEDDIHFLMSVAAVVTMAVERTQAEAQLQKLAAFTQLNPNPALELAADGRLLFHNEAATRLAAALNVDGPRGFFPAGVEAIVRACLSKGESRLRYESKIQGRTLSWSFHPVMASQVVHAYVEDITQRLQLEEQLRHAQRMESIGQLAAGVAHDFNNMLTVIQGHSGMLLTRPGLAKDVQDSAHAISFAAERATNLTRQLLMFSRKNVMQRQLLDLREVLSQMSKLLQRLLGETVQLEFIRTAELPLVEADAGMIEQVVMNLSVNARDAMPKGGTLTISVEQTAVLPSRAELYPDARPGDFVVVRVKDTGCGMSEATIKRIFEPFFTTKEVGKGTGLGLATVYGIAKQHDGWVEVSSEIDKGSEFRVFFPATAQKPQSKDGTNEKPALVKGGKETILIVEDEEILRDLACAILRSCGYEVLQAPSGPEALRVWENNRERIDLVLTDMIMPEGMTGSELAQKLRGSKPDLKIIYASGYNLEEIDAGKLDLGEVSFLQKPYTHVSLSKVVRESLDRHANGARAALHTRPIVSSP